MKIKIWADFKICISLPLEVPRIKLFQTLITTSQFEKKNMEETFK